MKKIMKTILNAILIIAILACIGSSIPMVIRMVKDISATPEPGAALTLEQACDFYGKVVEVEGRLELPRDVSCSTDEPITCRVELFDPYWRNSVILEIPVHSDTDNPPLNHMAALTDDYSRGDFFIAAAENRLARDGSFVSVRGVESGGSPCTIGGIEKVEILDRLSVDVGADLQSLTLQEALTEGLVVATIRGGGLFQVDISIKPKVEANYELIVEPGTMLIAGTEGVQNMVVREEKTIYLKPNLEVGLELDVSCANMHLDQPDGSHQFSIGSEPANEDMMKLLGLEDFAFEDLGLQQFAIWTITDNPESSFGYVGIETGKGTRFPEEWEIKKMKEMFVEAGLEPGNYKIFDAQ